MLNNCDYNIDQNYHGYDLFPERAALHHKYTLASFSVLLCNSQDRLFLL